jgi:hypothetical protein
MRAGRFLVRLAAASALSAAGLVSAPAWASAPSFSIEQIYSNADGSVQFVVLRETSGAFGQQAFSGQTLTATHAGVTKTFGFTRDLSSVQTALSRVLVGTTGLSALGFIAPDFVMPNGFLPTDGGTLTFAGVDTVTYASLPVDGASSIGRSGGVQANQAINFAGAQVTLPALSVAAIEYYNASLDHYFISPLLPDIDALDSGRIAGWTRTGQTFRVYPSQASGGPNVNPVCRFYIPPEHGNSHFFSASPEECAAIRGKIGTDPNYSNYVYETPNAFYVALPDATTGACAAGTGSVYRLWNQRADSNHRYIGDSSLRALMLGKGYASEGYGPDGVSMCVPVQSVATLTFGGTGGSAGVLVNDGSSGANAGNYQGFLASAGAATVGAHAGAGEAIIFDRDRAVSVQPVLWSTAFGSQTVAVPQTPSIDVPATIWVVAGPYTTTQQTALTLWHTASQIYDSERSGVHLSNVEIVDATTNPKASAWNAFTCGTNNASVAQIASDIGARSGRINVYLTGLVDGSTSRGNACQIGGSFVAIAAGSGSELLAHELGHDFGLEHIDDLTADFDVSNVMHSASNWRQFLTEGQIFRAHLRSASALNSVYLARRGAPVRDCDRDTLTKDCPIIKKRLWPDGAFPPN